MDFRNAWRLSKAPFVELTFRSVQLTRGSTQRGLGQPSEPSKLVKAAIRSSRINKITFTLLTCLISGILLFSGYVPNRTPSALVGSITLSLAFGFVYILVYLMQVLPSLPGGEPYALLSTLPMSQGDFSLVATLSVVRTFDYIVAGTAVTMTAGIAYLTGSAVAALLMLVASFMNSVFAIAIGVWLSRLFYTNITRSGRSRIGTLARLLFLITWGLAVGGIWFSFGLISRLLPLVNAAISGSLSQSVTTLVLIVHPIPVALAISSVVRGSTSGLGAVTDLAYTAFVAYLVLAYIAGRRTLVVVSRMVRGQGVRIMRQTAKEFSLRIRSPVTSYVFKDLRVASKNPSTAFIFALPVLETLFVSLNIFGHALRSATIISATLLGGSFTLISASALLNTEGTGLEYTLSLPLGARVIVRAKSLIATATYVPVPVAITLLLSTGRAVSWVLFVIPWLESLAIWAAASTELSFFLRNYRKRDALTGLRGSGTYDPRGLGLLTAGGLARLGAALLSAAAIIAAPVVSYALTYLVSVSHTESIMVMAVIAGGEVALVWALSNKFQG